MVRSLFRKFCLSFIIFAGILEKCSKIMTAINNYKWKFVKHISKIKKLRPAAFKFTDYGKSFGASGFDVFFSRTDPESSGHLVALHFCYIVCEMCNCRQNFEPQHEKTNTLTSAPSEDTDQPGHPPTQSGQCLPWVLYR